MKPFQGLGISAQYNLCCWQKPNQERRLHFQRLSCFAENNDQNYRHSLICPSLSNNALNQWKKKTTVAHVSLFLQDKVTLKTQALKKNQLILLRFSHSPFQQPPFYFSPAKPAKLVSLLASVCGCA